MLKRQTSGSVVCASCGYLVGVKDDKCYHCGRRNPALFGYATALRNLGHDAGFVPFVTGFCTLMYVLTVLAGGFQTGGGPLGFLAPTFKSVFVFGMSGAEPVFDYHRWWTLLSANWLHGGLLHLFMNMYGIRQLAPGVGEFYGPGRMVIIYTVAGVVGFATSTFAFQFFPFLPFFQGSQDTLGASAAIMGLLGALVYYGNRTGSRHVRGQAMSWALMTLVFGFVVAGIDNTAHVGGFAGGYVAGRLLDPLKPEQINHMLIAVVCLVLSVLSIVASVVHAMYLLR